MTPAQDRGEERAEKMMVYLGLETAALLVQGRIIPEDMAVAAFNCGICERDADCLRHIAKNRSGRPPAYCRNRVMLKELIRRPL